MLILRIRHQTNDNDTITSFASIDETDWLFAMTADMDVTFSPIQRIEKTGIIITVSDISMVILIVVLAIQLTVNSLNKIIKGVNHVAEEVSDSAGKVAKAGRISADNTLRQAAAVEETASMMEEISTTIKKNADNTDRVNDMMSTMTSTIGKAGNALNDISLAMEDISHAGDETTKIIKTIDEIAFQTNLLALNAAV